MTNKNRYLKKNIENALSKKMVFIGGARQVGKTQLSLEFLSPKSVRNKNYFNWDVGADRSQILKEQIPLNSPILVFDEIHKYKNWRNFIKGLYDKYHEDTQFIVTGSARLDYFRKGGDSLLGRYRYFRLHPFSILELNNNPTPSDLEHLLKFGGFPEPLLKMNINEHRIWQKERMHKVISEDLRDLENVKDNSLTLLLAEIISSKIGSPLSLQSLVEDLQVSQPTIKRWLDIFSLLYYTYSIAPYGAPKIRAVKKLQKIYMWDWSQVEEKGACFENLVASHLLKYCHFIEDTQGYNMELRYLRDTDGREIDFVILKDKNPIFAVECKTGDRQISSHISYFQQRTNIPAFYQVHLKENDFGHATTGRVLPFINFCKEIIKI